MKNNLRDCLTWGSDRADNGSNVNERGKTMKYNVYINGVKIATLDNIREVRLFGMGFAHGNNGDQQMKVETVTA